MVRQLAGQGSPIDFGTVRQHHGSKKFSWLMNGQRGDDLDDDFVPDELVATSGEEDNGPGDDIGGLLSADEDAEEAEVHIKEKPATEKKRKRREKEKERKIKKRKLAETVEVIEPLSVAVQPAHKLADYVSSMQVKAFPAMSGIELSDVLIPDSIIDCGYDEMDGIEIIRQSG